MSRSSAAEGLPIQIQKGERKSGPIVKKESIKNQAESAYKIESINRSIAGIEDNLEEIADEILQGYKLINKNKPDEEGNRINLTPQMRSEMAEDSDELTQELAKWKTERDSLQAQQPIDLPRVETIVSLSDQKDELLASQEKAEAELAEAQKKLAIAQRSLSKKSGFGSFLATSLRGGSEKGRIQATADLQAEVTRLEENLQVLKGQEETLNAKIEGLPNSSNLLLEARKKLSDPEFKANLKLDEVEAASQKANGQKIDKALDSLSNVLHETLVKMVRAVRDNNPSMANDLAERIVGYQEELKIWNMAKERNERVEKQKAEIATKELNEARRQAQVSAEGGGLKGDYDTPKKRSNFEHIFAGRDATDQKPTEARKTGPEKKVIPPPARLKTPADRVITGREDIDDHINSPAFKNEMRLADERAKYSDALKKTAEAARPPYQLPNGEWNRAKTREEIIQWQNEPEFLSLVNEDGEPGGLEMPNPKFVTPEERLANKEPETGTISWRVSEKASGIEYLQPDGSWRIEKPQEAEAAQPETESVPFTPPEKTFQPTPRALLPNATESQYISTEPPKKSWLPASVKKWGTRALVVAAGLVGIKIAAEPVTNFVNDIGTTLDGSQAGIKSAAEAAPMVQAAVRQEKVNAAIADLEAKTLKEKAEALVGGGAVEVDGKTVVIPTESKSRTRTSVEKTTPVGGTFNLQGEKAPGSVWNSPEQGTPQIMGVMPDSAPEGYGSAWGDSLTPQETKAQVDKNTEILMSFFISNPSRPITREQAGKAYTNLVLLTGKAKAYEKLTSISDMTNRSDQESMKRAIKTFSSEMES